MNRWDKKRFRNTGSDECENRIQDRNEWRTVTVAAKIHTEL